MNTHIHADHVTGSGLIKQHFKSSKSIVSKNAEANADVLIGENDIISFGDFDLNVIETPGHTNGCLTYYLKEGEKNRPMLFTGDTLLIRGCGRTDFQEGSSAKLYESVHSKLFTLPEDTTVYPAHDYNGRTSSTIYEEKRHNPRLTKGLDEFLQIMEDLSKKLSKPAKLEDYVPKNRNCGL